MADLKGQKFGKLQVESFAGVSARYVKNWNCVCECGNRSVVREDNLGNGNTKSCGRCPNRFEPFGDSVVIWLEMKDRDVPCYIDAADYPLVKDYRWTAIKNKKVLYARAWIQGERGAKKTTPVYMHALIMGKGADHKEHGDGLNNRRENLRPATGPENACNKGSKANATGFKGVCLSYGLYVARIAKNGKRHRLGNYNTALEAARAYNEAAKELHGEFAVLNELPEDDLIFNQNL
jgi:hypothetical protein